MKFYKIPEMILIPESFEKLLTSQNIDRNNISEEEATLLILHYSMMKHYLFPFSKIDEHLRSTQ